MKKLLTILAATTATLFAFGVGASQPPINVADFEPAGFTAGEAFSTATNDEGGADAPLYWYTEDTDASNVISNYPSSGQFVPIASRPDARYGIENTKFLQIETTGKLYRSVTPSNGSNDFLTNGLSIAETPIYLDTLVKFTAADSAFGDDALADGDKIAISYVEHESEGTGDEAYTNFVVRAGYVTGSTTVAATNYIVNVPEGFDKEQWHRLTVRTISNVGDGSVGFVVYLDETNLTYSTGFAAGVASYTDAINSDVQSKFYNSEKHALFPSAVRTGSEKTTIAAASFSGNGSLDDVVFTTVRPSFIQESSLVTVTWDTNAVTALTVNELELTPAQLEGGAFDFNPDNNGSVTFDVTFASGYVLGECKVTGGAGGWNGSNAFTNLASGVTCNIVSMLPLYEVSFGSTTNYYDNLETATTAAKNGGSDGNPATFKLLENCNVSLNFGSGYIILDLAGHTITGDADNDAAIMNNGANLLIITNSTVALGHVVPATDKNAVYIDAATTIIAGGSIDGGVDGANSGADVYLTITGGQFLDGEYDPSDPDSEFYLADFVASGLTATYAEIGGANYFQVGGGSQSTTFELTLNGGENAEIVTDPATITGFTEATNVTITATATNGFTYAGVDVTGWTYNDQTDAISVTTNISENTTLVVPDAVAKVIGTYQITVIPTNNTTYAVTGAASNVGDVYTVATGHAITITVIPDSNYEYASAPDGWTAGQDGVITKEISAAGSVEIPGPTAKSNWPSTWNSGNEPASMTTAFNNWIAVSGNDPTAANAEAAFLVGVNLADYTNDLAVASITLADGKVVITGNYNLSSVNGALAVKMGNAPNALGEPTAVTATEGAISLTPALGETKKFYQLVIGYPAN